MGKLLKIIGGIVVLALVGGCAVVGMGVFAVGNAANEQQERSEAAAANPAAIGEDVTVKDVRWKVLEVTDLGNTLTSTNQFIDDVTTPGHFVQVRFEIENQAKEMKSFSGLDLLDSKEREYKSSSDTLSFLPEGEVCIIENLNPNVPKTCTAIYAVPEDATGLMARVGDLNPLSSEYAYVNLGQ
ncbi:MAG: hypothetical protein RLZZ387_299 [Chloroflexota bacterium]|jgi:hypothetical protein